MNPLRFRLLRRKRNTKILPPISALLAAAVLLCPVRAVASPSPQKAVGEILDSLKTDCDKDLDDAHSIYQKDHKTLKSTYDMDVQCPKNTGEEPSSYNIQAVEKNVKLARLRRPFASGLNALHQLGACRLAYSGIHEVFDHFASMREQYCEEIGTLLQQVKDCGVNDVSRCQDEWKALSHAQHDYVGEIIRSQKDADLFLDALANTAVTAGNNYRSDLTHLDPVFGSHASASAKKPADSLPDAPEVKAANGNKDSQAANSLQTYYTLLHSSSTPSIITLANIPNNPADLIAEEDVAALRVANFKGLLKKPLDDYKAKAMGADKYFAEVTEKQDPSKNTSFTKKLAGYVPSITGIADPASKLLNNNNSSDNSSPTSGGGGDSHAGLGEVAAAAGLGAVVAKSLGSAGGDSGASQDAPVTSPNPGKVDGPAPGVLGGDPAAPESHGGPKADATPAAPAAPVAKNEPNQPETPGTFVPGGGSQGGSSRMLAGKYAGPANGSAPATGVVQGGTAAPELGSSFSSNLEPHSAPRSTPPSVGGEVANLLGQMKNLFNFDEATSPGGSLGGAPMPGGGPPDAAGGPAPLLGGADMPGGGPDPAAADAGANPEGSPETVAAGGETQLDPVRGSPFGRLDTTLFDRVRARHHRCMERGQILYGLKERVE